MIACDDCSSIGTPGLGVVVRPPGAVARGTAALAMFAAWAAATITTRSRTSKKPMKSELMDSRRLQDFVGDAIGISGCETVARLAGIACGRHGLHGRRRQWRQERCRTRVVGRGRRSRHGRHGRSRLVVGSVGWRVAVALGAAGGDASRAVPFHRARYLVAGEVEVLARPSGGLPAGGTGSSASS